MLNNNSMNAMLTDKLHVVEEVEAHEPEIMLKLNPALLDEMTLTALMLATEPNGMADALRSWLREVTLRETGRRITNDEGTMDCVVEADAWRLPWHTFNDAQLADAVGCSYSWLVVDVTPEIKRVFEAVHMAVVAACATRLRELHTAIQRGRK